jgi:hypothetical protein
MVYGSLRSRRINLCPSSTRSRSTRTIDAIL